MPGGSYLTGKTEIRDYLKKLLPIGSTALDVGAGAGIYSVLIGDHYKMDAVEIWYPNIEVEELNKKYLTVFHADIRTFEFPHKYDLIIMGDIVEHLDIDDAQKSIKKCLNNCQYLMVAVPYRLKQGPIYGNRFECHRQSDLTPEIFNERYPGFKLVVGNDIYGYYINE